MHETQVMLDEIAMKRATAASKELFRCRITDRSRFDTTELPSDSYINSFYNSCTKDLDLNIVGLMCFPPINSDTNKFFKILKKASLNLNLKHLSMGMSTDYENAVLNGSTFLRIGTAILGERNNLTN